jgi:hypothetical protein
MQPGTIIILGGQAEEERAERAGRAEERAEEEDDRLK